MTYDDPSANRMDSVTFCLSSSERFHITGIGRIKSNRSAGEDVISDGLRL